MSEGNSLFFDLVIKTFQIFYTRTLNESAFYYFDKVADDRYRFNWKDNNMPSAGLIAQDVEKYLPELVDSTTGEFKALNYSGIIGVLVEAVKELSSKIKTLEEENGN